MTDWIYWIFVCGIGAIVVSVAGVLIIAYSLKAHELLQAGLHALGLSEPRTPGWRRALHDWEECHSGLVRRTVVSMILFLGLAVAWSTLHRLTVDSGRLAVLLVAEFLDQATWQFWVVIAAGLTWLYSYRKNRRRQEAIIELLVEIRSSLGKRSDLAKD